MNNKLLTIIIPVFNEQSSLHSSIRNLLICIASIKLRVKIVLVDDGSKDDSWDVIRKLSEENERIEGICLSRNFGKDYAILAGLENYESDYYVVIDSDGEHPFELIGDVSKKLIESQFDILHGVKNSRRGSRFYKFFARKYNKIFNTITNLDLNESSDFKIFNLKVRNAIVLYGDVDYFFRGIAQDVGFYSGVFHFDENSREIGSSSWGSKKLLGYALNTIISFSHFPLYIILFFGFLSFLISSSIAFKWLIQYVFFNNLPEGYSTVILLLVLSFGLIMISLGIIGIYLSKIFDLSKRRPRYLISKKIKNNFIKKSDDCCD